MRFLDPSRALQAAWSRMRHAIRWRVRTITPAYALMELVATPTGNCSARMAFRLLIRVAPSVDRFVQHFILAVPWIATPHLPPFLPRHEFAPRARDEEL